MSQGHSSVRLGGAAAYLTFLLLAAGSSLGAHPQNLAQTAAAESSSGKSPRPSAVTPSSTKPKLSKPETRHLAVTIDPALEAENRRKLEENAGEDAGRVLLRSVPGEAQVWVEDSLVGKTPLLLILAPGTYPVKLTTLGASAEQRVAVLPRESQVVLIRLRVRYPAEIRLP